MKKAVFLDRDGTINPDEFGYISQPEDFHLFPFAAEAISILNKLDFLVFIVSNQSGIARGFYTEKDLEKVHTKMLAELEQNGAQVTDIFYSPYHQEGTIEPFNIEHEDRKPGLGMFKQALQKYQFPIKDSFMIGDKYSDIAFGRKAGLTTILVRSGEGNAEFLQKRKEWEQKPHYIVNDLLSAVRIIEELENK
ncbi:MAG: HAD family hydrolase [Candidatus Cloacimonadales bacterium]|nr:HAD family hydrolase [Candidatus Cloacimonadales bacterium]